MVVTTLALDCGSLSPGCRLLTTLSLGLRKEHCANIVLIVITQQETY